MQIIKITDSEPSRQHEQEKSLGVGIDFGTTNSLVAFSQDQIVKIIHNDKMLELTPSTIGFKKREFIIGDISNEKIAKLSSIKRLFGKKLSELQANPSLFMLVKDYIDLDSEILRLKFASKSMTIPELAAQIFIYLKKQVTRELNSSITKAVITVPAHFNDAARGEVILAAKIAGFEVLRLVAEPTAAAYAYGLNKKPPGHYLVYDLGGGTFDVSILNMQAGVLQVIATGGDNILGGDDIDYLVMNHFCDKYKLSKCEELMKLAKKAKEVLSFQTEFNDIFAGQIVELRQEGFEQLILPLLNRTLDITKDTLKQVKNANISGIVLVGGATRIPLIRRNLKQEFNLPVFSDINPDKAVVCGAALQAENLTSPNINALLIDVVPLSLGIELNGGITEKLIWRNTPIPISVTKEFTTSVDNQLLMKLHIVQGEREMVEDCRSLAKFALELPLMKAGEVKTEITFSIDTDGILSVAALEKNSGASHAISVKPSYGLSEDEINEILEDARQNVIEDHHKKLLQEALIHGQSLIYNVEKAVKEIGKFLEEEEIKTIQDASQRLKEKLRSNDCNSIQECSKNFESITGPIIGSKVNEIIKRLLKGKHVEDI